MKAILVLFIIFYLNISNVRAETKLECLKRVVRDTVGNDPKYNDWMSRVDYSIDWVSRRTAECSMNDPEKAKWCLIDLDLYTGRWYATYVNQLSQLDREPNWTAITQACVDTKVESKLECLKRVVREIVGNNEKYDDWVYRVDSTNAAASNRNLECSMIDQPETAKECFEEVNLYIRTRYANYVKQLSQIDDQLNWATITKVCVQKLVNSSVLV